MRGAGGPRRSLHVPCFTALHGEQPMEHLIGIAVLIVYFALQGWILPRLGIPT